MFAFAIRTSADASSFLPLIGFCFAMVFVDFSVFSLMALRMSFAKAVQFVSSHGMLTLILNLLRLLPAVSLLIKEHDHTRFQLFGIAFAVAGIALVGAGLNRWTMMTNCTAQSTEHLCSFLMYANTFTEIISKCVAFTETSPIRVVGILAGHHIYELLLRQNERFAVGMRRICSRRARMRRSEPLHDAPVELEWATCMFAHSVRDGCEVSAHVVAAFIAWKVGWMSSSCAALSLACSLSFELAMDILGILLLKDAGLNAFGQIQRPFTFMLAFQEFSLPCFLIPVVLMYLHGNPLGEAR